MTWSTRKVEAQVGEYAVATRTITEHFSVDGRFLIRRSGGMRYCRAMGFYGQKSNRWVWSGYMLIDLITNHGVRCSTVAMAKRRASRLVQRGQEVPA